MFSTFIHTYKFRAYGVYIDAFTNENGKIKKCTSHPPGKATEKRTEGTKYPKKDLIQIENPDIKYNYFGELWSIHEHKKVKPNGIAIITKHSNISCLDVDKPEQCLILDRLLEDCNFIIKTKNGYHFYFNKENILPRNDCRNGIIDINTGLLFFCPEYKHIENGAVFKYEIIKNKKILNDMPEYAINYCKTLISISDNTTVDKIKTKKYTNTSKPELVIKPDIEINKFNIETLDCIFDIFYNSKDIKGIGFFESYEGWRNIGFMARHLNNSYEALELYHKYCIKVDEFKNSTINNNAIGFYGNQEYNLNFDTNLILYKCCKLDRQKYSKTLKHLEINKYDNKIIKFNTEFIKPITGENDYIFNDWINTYKILCLKSAYGTGKTYTFKKLIDESLYVKNGNVESKMKRILFITYRQSLATSLSNDLNKNYGFKNYLDIEGSNYNNEDRLILQLDSIYKLDNTYENNDLIQGFDFNSKDYKNKNKQKNKEKFDKINDDIQILEEKIKLSKCNSIQLNEIKNIMIDLYKKRDSYNYDSDSNNSNDRDDSDDSDDNDDNMFDMKGYDLLVLDEIEGILNHLSFNKINQFQIHNKLVKLIETSKKVLVLDGDLADRTLDFISNISNSYKIYENEYKTQSKHFKFTHLKTYMDDEIENDMRNNLKIVIVSMTKNDTVKYYNQYTELGKKCIIHNSLMKNKEILEDVNNTWIDCDLLTYSPAVESGVDFNIIDHFDKCYAILEKRSTSFRAFCQMLNRIRHYKQNNIICFMPLDMRYKLDDVLIRFDEIKMQKYKGLEITNLLNILIHNDVEKYNSKNYFITSLCNMLEKKGHTYEEIKQEDIEKDRQEEKENLIYSDKIQNLLENGTDEQKNDIHYFIDNDNKKYEYEHLLELRELYRNETLEGVNMINGVRRTIKGKDAIITSIIESRTLTNLEFNLLLNKQKKNKQITDDELLSVNKMLYKKVFKFWNIEDMNFNKLKEIYNTIENIKNYENLLFNARSTDTISRVVKDDNDILGKFEMNKLIYVNNLLQNLGYKFYNDNIVLLDNITPKIHLTKFEDYKNIIIEFIKKHMTLYNCERTFKSINWLKCLNDILGLYGLEANKSRIQKRIDGKMMEYYEIIIKKMVYLNIYINNWYEYYYTSILFKNDVYIYNDIYEEYTFKDYNRFDLKIFLKNLENKENIYGDGNMDYYGLI